MCVCVCVCVCARVFMYTSFIHKWVEILRFLVMLAIGVIWKENWNLGNMGSGPSSATNQPSDKSFNSIKPRFLHDTQSHLSRPLLPKNVRPDHWPPSQNHQWRLPDPLLRTQRHLIWHKLNGMDFLKAGPVTLKQSQFGSVICMITSSSKTQERSLSTENRGSRCPLSNWALESHEPQPQKGCLVFR